MLLPNGSMIKNDVIEAFNSAVANDENLFEDGGINWNFVEADMIMDLDMFYSTSYINECFEVLADEFELQQSWDRLNVLRTDYLSLEAV